MLKKFLVDVCLAIAILSVLPPIPILELAPGALVLLFVVSFFIGWVPMVIPVALVYLLRKNFFPLAQRLFSVEVAWVILSLWQGNGALAALNAGFALSVVAGYQLLVRHWQEAGKPELA